MLSVMPNSGRLEIRRDRTRLAVDPKFVRLTASGRDRFALHVLTEAGKRRGVFWRDLSPQEARTLSEAGIASSERSKPSTGGWKRGAFKIAVADGNGGRMLVPVIGYVRDGWGIHSGDAGDEGRWYPRTLTHLGSGLAALDSGSHTVSDLKALGSELAERFPEFTACQGVEATMAHPDRDAVGQAIRDFLESRRPV